MARNASDNRYSTPDDYLARPRLGTLPGEPTLGELPQKHRTAAAAARPAISLAEVEAKRKAEAEAAARRQAEAEAAERACAAARKKRNLLWAAGAAAAIVTIVLYFVFR